MPKYPKHKAEQDGWTTWINPKISGYEFACCDCGLVHTLQFRVVADDGGPMIDTEVILEGAAVIMRVRRNNRATGQKRRHQKTSQNNKPGTNPQGAQA